MTPTFGDSPRDRENVQNQKRAHASSFKVKVSRHTMNQGNKIVKRLSYAAATGAGAVALTLAALPLFEPTRDVVVGQTPSVAASGTALSGSTQQGAAPTSTGSNYAQPIPAAPSTPVTPAPTAPGVALMNQSDSNASLGDLPSLRARAQQLQAQLQKMPTSLAEQTAQTAAYNELLDVQSQIQRLEMAAGQFSSYSQARNRMAGVDGANAQTQSPYAAAQAQNRRQILANSGLNTGAPASVAPGQVTTQAEFSLLQEQRDALLQNYRQIQQTLRALQPGDAALAENLRLEQNSIAAQLREIDEKLAAAPASAQIQQLPQANGANPTSGIPAQNQLLTTPSGAIPTLDVSLRIQKVSQAAQLLREAGLAQLANYAATEAPKLADPNFQEQSLVPGSWAESDGLSEARNNPFAQQVKKDDVDALSNKIDDLQSQIEKLTKAFADVEAQLKLLTRNTASTLDQTTVPAPTSEPQTNDATSEQAAPTGASTDGEIISGQPVAPQYETLIPSSQNLEDGTLPPIPGSEDFDNQQPTEQPTDPLGGALQ